MSWLYEPHLQELKKELEDTKQRLEKCAILAQSKARPPIISATHSMLVAKGRAYAELCNILEHQIATAEEHKQKVQ